MKIQREQLKLYAVTDRSWLRPGETLAQAVEELLAAGVTCVQLREKQVTDETIIEEAHALQDCCRRYHVPLIINDRPDLALQVKAAGVHVGQSDMAIAAARKLLGPSYIIGGSAHNVAEALAAQEAGADYLGCGAVFGSRTKQNVQPLSIAELKAICSAVSIPVVAIGGIDTENVIRIKDTGISGVAVVSALFAAADKTAAAKAFLKQF